MKVPRRMAWRVMMPKKISTMFSHEQLVGVKCRVTLGFLSSQAVTLGCVWVVVPPKSWRVSYAASGLVLDSLIS